MPGGVKAGEINLALRVIAALSQRIEAGFLEELIIKQGHGHGRIENQDDHKSRFIPSPRCLVVGEIKHAGHEEPKSVPHDVPRIAFPQRSGNHRYRKSDQADSVVVESPLRKASVHIAGTNEESPKENKNMGSDKNGNAVRPPPNALTESSA